MVNYDFFCILKQNFFQLEQTNFAWLCQTVDLTNHRKHIGHKFLEQTLY